MHTDCDESGSNEQPTPVYTCVVCGGAIGSGEPVVMYASGVAHRFVIPCNRRLIHDAKMLTNMGIQITDHIVARLREVGINVYDELGIPAPHN